MIEHFINFGAGFTSYAYANMIDIGFRNVLFGSIIGYTIFQFIKHTIIGYKVVKDLPFWPTGKNIEPQYIHGFKYILLFVIGMIVAKHMF